MDTSRTSKIVVEAESKIATLDEALGRGDADMAGWILTVLSGMMQDLQRLVEEEPVPMEIDRKKLSETMDTALAVMDQLRIGIEEHDYCLASTNSFLLHPVLNDILELIRGERARPTSSAETP